MKNKITIEYNVDCDDIIAYLNANPDLRVGEYFKEYKDDNNV